MVIGSGMFDDATSDCSRPKYTQAIGRRECSEAVKVLLGAVKVLLGAVKVKAIG